MKQIQPDCLVLGVEPEGNDVVRRSLASGTPEQAAGPGTIADSLSPPYALPYSLGLMRRFVDDVVLVGDTALQVAMYVLFARMKLAVEPAGAASTAALLGPLATRLGGKRVGLVVCGSNIDRERFSAYLQLGAEQWNAR